MKKVETIQEIADKYFDRWDPDAHRDSFAAYIIKSERERVRRLVRKVKNHAEVSVYGAGYQKACDDMMTRLKERR